MKSCGGWSSMTSTSLPDEPMVSIVTPTFPGREAELRRCANSVRALDWPRIQHVIVSDRNPAINAHHSYECRLGWARNMVIVEINESWRNEVTENSTGSYPWMIGSRLALGDFVAFLGDDDELLPHHVRTHVERMRAEEAMFSVSKVQFRIDGADQFVIGDPALNLGGLDATGIMCYKDALRYGIWDANGNNAGDWQMVDAWKRAGLRGAFIDEITGIHNDG